MPSCAIAWSEENRWSDRGQGKGCQVKENSRGDHSWVAIECLIITRSRQFTLGSAAIGRRLNEPVARLQADSRGDCGRVTTAKGNFGGDRCQVTAEHYTNENHLSYIESGLQTMEKSKPRPL